MYTRKILVRENPPEAVTALSEYLSVKESNMHLLSSSSCENVLIPNGTAIPPDLPKMFLDLLVPVKGLKIKKLPYDCSICGEELATYNSLVIHNKSHSQPACLLCGIVLTSVSKLATHTAQCQKTDSIVVTSKYGRSRPVKSYLANLK